MQNYIIKNKTKRTVNRGGFTFHPYQTVELGLSEAQRFFLNASSFLSVNKVEESKTEEDIEEVEFSCPKCEKKYKTERGLKQHLQNKHGGE